MMKLNKPWVLCAFVLAALLVGCIKEGVFESEGPLEQGYFLYAGNWGFWREDRNDIYIIDTQNNTVVDTFSVLEGAPIDLAISSDGSILYATVFHSLFESDLYQLDTRTKEILSVFSLGKGRYRLKSSPDMSLFLIFSKYGLHIFDTLSGAIICSDTLSFTTAAFAPNKPILYGALFPKDNQWGRIVVYNYESKEKSRVIEVVLGHRPTIKDMLVSPDGKELYLTAHYSALGFYLGVVDLEKDSLVTKISIITAGKLAMSSDGAYLYIADPGIKYDPDSPPIVGGKITIFRTADHFVAGWISTIGLAGVQADALATEDFVITPDDIWAYASTHLAGNVPSSNGGWARPTTELATGILVIDLTKREVVNVIKFSTRNNAIGPIVLGPKRKIR